MDRSGIVVAAVLAGGGYWAGGSSGAWAGLFLFGMIAAFDAVHRWISSLRTQLDLHGMALDRIQERLSELHDQIAEVEHRALSAAADAERAAGNTDWLCKRFDADDD